MAVRAQQAAFDPGAESNAFIARTNGAGAAVSFTGLVRSLPGQPVATLVLDCYPELALNQIGRMIEQATALFELLDATVIHRYGALEAGEPFVQVIALASHRQAALAAADVLIDYL